MKTPTAFLPWGVIHNAVPPIFGRDFPALFAPVTGAAGGAYCVLPGSAPRLRSECPPVSRTASSPWPPFSWGTRVNEGLLSVIADGGIITRWGILSRGEILLAKRGIAVYHRKKEGGDGVRILIAEKDGAEEIAAALRKNRYAAELARNGEDAFARLQTGAYDAAVLDVLPAGADGVAVVKRLRAAGNPVPVLLLGVRSGVEDTVLGLDSGANDYMTKPFDMRELLARVRAMLRTAGAREKPAFGNTVLDLNARTLSTPSGAVRLTRREFGLMEILITQPHTLFSTERLLEKIWGADAPEIGAVWVYVASLRKKLAALYADIRIVSSRNAGYCLEKAADVAGTPSWVPVRPPNP